MRDCGRRWIAVLPTALALEDLHCPRCHGENVNLGDEAPRDRSVRVLSRRNRQPARTIGPDRPTLATRDLRAEHFLGKSQAGAYKAANPASTEKNAGLAGAGSPG